MFWPLGPGIAIIRAPAPGIRGFLAIRDRLSDQCLRLSRTIRWRPGSARFESGCEMAAKVLVS